MSTFFEEMHLPIPRGELVETIRRSAPTHGLRVSDEAGTVLVTRPIPAWLGFPFSIAVFLEVVQEGTVARFLSWNARGSDGQLRKLILQLINVPAPVYGPPGATVDAAAPRDLYRPLGTALPAPPWVRRTNLIVWSVSAILFAAFVVAAYFWGLAGLPLLWLASLSALCLREVMFRRALHLPPTEGLAGALLSATSYPVLFAVVWVLETQVFR